MGLSSRSSFDNLLDEIAAAGRFSKSISTETDEDDERIAAAAGEEGDRAGRTMDSPRTVALGKVLKQFGEVVLAQAAAIRKLKARLDALDQGGAGKPLQKASSNVDGEEFLAKALAAQASGRLSGVQVAIAEAHVNSGRQPPADIVRAVMAEASPALAEGVVQ